jgi:ATP-dependent Zn protease
LEDTAVPWETSQRILDRIIVTFGGSAAERVILGEHTDGSESDFDAAVDLAMRWIQAGFTGPKVFVVGGQLGPVTILPTGDRNLLGADGQPPAPAPLSLSGPRARSRA